MNSALKKLIGIGLGIVVVLSSVLFVYLKFSSEKQNSINISIYSAHNSSYYDPASVTISPDTIVTNNIFSRMVFHNYNGEIIQGIATNFEWQKDLAIFKIPETFKTAQGKQITPKDIVFSIKRLMVLDKNRAKSLPHVLCYKPELNNINDECPGLYTENNNVIMKPKGIKLLLFPMLAGLDFGIVPQDSTDPTTLKIIDYKNTSGPYYIESAVEGEYISLKANKFHPYYSEKTIPQIKLIQTETNYNTKDSKLSDYDHFINKSIDIIPALSLNNSTGLLKQFKDNNEVSIYNTLPIKSIFLVFTPKGMQLPLVKRLSLGNKIRKTYYDVIQKMQSPAKPANEFFSVLTEGTLSPEQKDQISKQFSSVITDETGEGVSIFGSDIMPQFHIFKEPLPKLKWIPFKTMNDWYGLSEEDINENMPDMFVMEGDTGFQDEVGLLSYWIGSGIFGMTKQGRKDWLENYLRVENEAERITLLKNLHFSSLSTAKIVPISVAPYYSFMRKPLTIQFSHYTGIFNLWKIYQN